LTALKLEEPIGSLPVSLPILILRSIRRSFDPEYRQKQFERLDSRLSDRRAKG